MHRPRTAFVFIAAMLCSISFANYVNEGSQCPGLPEGSSARLYDCIMVEGTPCMMYTDPVICPGTVNPDEPDWGPIAWIGGSGTGICYCPYSLADKCYGKYDQCPDQQCNGNTLETGGGCRPATGECAFSSTQNCAGGCNPSTFLCNDPCMAVTCPDKCEGSTWSHDGYCSKSDGSCVYAIDSCQNGCDASANACKTAGQPIVPETPSAQDKCADVECLDKCIGTTQYSYGECDPSTGKCDYTQTPCDAGEICQAGTGQCAPPQTAEICYDNIDNDANGYMDCQDAACASNPVCGPLKGRVYFTDLEGTQRLLPNVYLLARWVTEDGTQAESTQEFYSDGMGEYVFDDPELHVPGTHNVQMVVRLYDNGQRITVAEAGTPVEQVVDIPLAAWASGAPQDLAFQDYNEKDGAHPRDAAKFYFHATEYASFASQMLSQIGINGGIGAEKTNIHYGYEGGKGAWHTRHDSPDAGMYYEPVTSIYTNNEAPGNREYHEYSHHLMNQVYGGMPPRHSDDENHGGIKNGCSTDAYVEGFAEFTSLVANRQTGIPKRCGLASQSSLYCWDGTGSDLEKDYQATKDEEFAVAGILWDLYDNAEINGAPDDDSVSISYDKLWAALTKVRSFNNYSTGDVSPRHIWYVKDLYDALMEDGYDKAGVNEIFKSHGYYFLNELGPTPEYEYGVTLWKQAADGLYYYKTDIDLTDGKFFRRY